MMFVYFAVFRTLIHLSPLDLEAPLAFESGSVTLLSTHPTEHHSRSCLAHHSQHFREFLYSFLIRNFIFSYEGWKRENVCNFLLVFILDNESCGDEATRSRTFLADRRVRILLRVSNKNHCCCYRFHKNSWDKDFFILSWTFRPVRLHSWKNRRQQ